MFSAIQFFSVIHMLDARNADALFGGIALALSASFCFNVGLALQKRAALSLPRVRGWSPATVVAFVRNRAWLAANATIAAGWILQFLALRIAPIGVVMPAVAAGVVFQAWLAVRWFGERLGASESCGIAACAVGVVLIGMSIDSSLEIASSSIDLQRTGLVVVVLGASSAFAIGAARFDSRWSESGLAIAAGLLYAGTGLLTKVLGIFAARDGAALEVALTVLVMLALGGAAIFVLQAAQQRGRALVVVPVMGVLADFLPALLGPLVFGEVWPRGRFAWLRLAALLTILIGMFLLARTASRLHAEGEVVD
jgi:drug/metabolite transporter (DMT)-like permease